MWTPARRLERDRRARGEETQSVRMEITVRCGGPAGAERQMPVFHDSASLGLFFFFNSPFFNILQRLHGGAVKLAEKKSDGIGAEHKRPLIKAPCSWPSVDAKVRNLLPAGCWSTSPQQVLQRLI